MKIEALHDFHDSDFSREWAAKFKPTKERLLLFETILKQIAKVEFEDKHILELGIGPGFLARYLLENHNDISYEGLDYSESMLKIASERTADFSHRIKFTQADLMNDQWFSRLQDTPNIIVSTWSLHDLFEKRNISRVYEVACKILPKGGTILNGDFIKPEESTREYEGGRIKPSEHRELLKNAGFNEVTCIAEFEKSIDNPTTSNNYACFRAIK